MRFLLLSLAPLVLSMLSVSATKAANGDPQTVILAHVRLIDGTGAPAQRQYVRRHSRRQDRRHYQGWFGCTGIGARDRLLRQDRDARPDQRARASGAGVRRRRIRRRATRRNNVIAQLRQYERYGVTSMLSLGVNRDLIYEVRAEQRAGKLDGATVYSADRGIGVPDGAPPLPHAPDQLYTPKTPAEARADVDAMASRHADFVKIWVDNLHGTKPSMDPAVYRAVIDEAHRDKLPVAAHMYYLADAKAVVADGVNVLAHSVRDQAVDEELLAAMKQRGVYYIPTLTVDASVIHVRRAPGVEERSVSARELSARSCCRR